MKAATKEVTDADLLAFLEWYFNFNGRNTERIVILAISASGRFHMTEKMATPLIRRAIASGFLKKDGKERVIFQPDTATKKRV